MNIDLSRSELIQRLFQRGNHLVTRAYRLGLIGLPGSRSATVYMSFKIGNAALCTLQFGLQLDHLGRRSDHRQILERRICDVTQGFVTEDPEYASLRIIPKTGVKHP